MENLPVRRTTQGAVLGGVCAGLARRWRLDPVVLRVAFVVLSLFSGLGVALYVGAVLLVPKDGASELPVRGLLPFTRDWSTPSVVGAVIGLGVLLMVALAGLAPLGMGPAIGLGLLWYFGWYRNRAQLTPPATGTTQVPAAQNTGVPPAPGVMPLPATDFQRASAAWGQRVAEHRAQSEALARGEHPDPTLVADVVPPLQFFGMPTPPAPPVPVTQPLLPVPVAPAPARRAAWLWPATAAVVGTQLVVLVLLGLIGGVDMGPTVFLAASLAWVALALVISAFVGRPRWLLATALGLAAATVVSLAPLGRFGQVTVGEDTWTYAAVSELPDSRTMDAGDLRVDLAALPITAADEVTFQLRLGELNLVLPRTGNVEVVWSVKAGSATMPRAAGPAEGLNLTGSYPRILDPSQPTLRIHVLLDAGELVVTE